MKKLMVLICSVMMIASLAFSFAACKGDEGGKPSGDVSEKSVITSVETSDGESADESFDYSSATSEVGGSSEGSGSADQSGDDSSGGTTPIVEPEDDGVMSVLFLGNSLMFFNDFYDIFENMAIAAGKNVFVRSVTQGSATITKFADPTSDIGNQTYKYLQSSIQWDYVILEPSRRTTPYDNTVRQSEIEAAKRLSALAAQKGTKTLLYSVWGFNSGAMTIYKVVDGYNMTSIGSKAISHSGHAKFLHDFNVEVSEAIGGAPLTRTGLAFENCMEDYPDINLYASDNAHPSLEGSFLAACTVYDAIYGEPSAATGYTQGISSAARLCKIADETVLDNRTPDITFTPEDSPNIGAYKILIVGSSLMSNHAIADVFANLWQAAEGREVYAEYLRSSSFTFHDLLNENTDLGLRYRLSEVKWDAIVLQLTRRMTISSTAVQTSEFQALRTIVPMLKENTENITLFTLNSSSNPSIFTVSGDGSYVKTDNKETCTAAEGTEYFAELATQWSNDFGIKKTLYGNAYIEYGGGDDATLGYMQACCLYNTFTGKGVPNECTEYNGLDAATAARVRAVAEKYCIDQKEPDLEKDYKLLVLGSSFMSSYSLPSVYQSLAFAADGSLVNTVKILDGSFTIQMIADEDEDRAQQMRTALFENNFDAIVIQLTRRCTISSPEVAEAELAALREILPLLKANTPNVSLFLLDSEKNPTRFTVNAAGKIDYLYDGTGAKVKEGDGHTAAIGTQYMADVAKAWADELDIGVIYYGSTFLEYTKDAAYTGEVTEEIGYLRACCMYNVVNGEIPASCAEYNGLTEAKAMLLRSYAENAGTYPVAEEPEGPVTPEGEYNMLVLGSDLISNHSPETPLASMMLSLEKLTLNTTYLTSSNFVIRSLVSEDTDLGMRNALADKTWDAIVIQMTRRMSPSGAAVEASELAALTEIMPLLKANTENVYLIYLNGTATPEVYTVDDGGAYVSAGTSEENVSAADTTSYYDATAKAWAEELSIGYIPYGRAYLEYNGSTGSAIGYIRACCYYNVLTQKTIPASCTEYNGLSESAALRMRGYAEKYCLPKEEDPNENKFNILIIGAPNIVTSYSMGEVFGAIVAEQDGITVNVEYISNTSYALALMVNEMDDLGLRTKLAATKWDAIVVQITRRLTPNAADIEASELAALKVVAPLMLANTENVYLFAPNCDSSPTMFYVKEDGSYAKTGGKDTCTAAEGIAYYNTIATAWSLETGVKVIRYGSAYQEYTSRTEAGVGYLQACCVYYATMGKQISDDTAAVNGLTLDKAALLRGYAYEYCLIPADDDQGE